MRNKGLEFDQAQKWDYYEFFHGNIPALVARVDGFPVGIGGVIRRNHQWWGFFEIRGRNTREHNLEIVRMMRRWLKSHNIDVYVQCDSFQHPQAPRLLKSLGFKNTNTKDQGMEVWLWQKSDSC